MGRENRDKVWNIYKMKGSDVQLLIAKYKSSPRGFSGTCDVSREGTGADFHAFESKLGIPELRTLRTWGQRSLILRL